MHERIVDAAIIGGGPGGLLAAAEAVNAGLNAVMISESWGGCMSMMGKMPLQSYPEELRFGSAAVELEDYMASGGVTPTGEGYARYIGDSIGKLPVDRIAAEVYGLERTSQGIVIHLHEGSSSYEMMARHAVLATGLSPRPAVACGPAEQTMTCFEAYDRLRNQPLTAGLGQHVLIIGSGNSAFQLALGYARSASAVTILANQWLGVFPQETNERFALRGISQHTLERIAKSSRTDCTSPFNPAGQHEIAPIAVHIYEKVWQHENGAAVVAIVAQQRNVSRVPALCFNAARAVGCLHERPSEAGLFEISFPVENLLIISAIGVQAQVPEHGFSNLIDPKTGFIAQERGQTSIANLSVAGACGGDPSVNTMKRPMLELVL